MSKYQIEDPGKVVTIKQSRVCDHCQTILPAKTRAFSQSVVRKINKKQRKRVRVWTCLSCPKPNEYTTVRLAEWDLDKYKEPTINIDNF